MSLFGITVIILLIILIVLGTSFYLKNSNSSMPASINKKENYENIPSDYKNLKFGNRNSFYTFLENGLKGTPVRSIESIETKRFPFIIENTTNYFNSDTPTISSGNELGTNIGKLPRSMCQCSR